MVSKTFKCENVIEMDRVCAERASVCMRCSQVNGTSMDEYSSIETKIPEFIWVTLYIKQMNVDKI